MTTVRFSILLLLTTLAGTCFAQLYYSPADANLYMVFPNRLVANGSALFRFQNGGSQFSCVTQGVPGGVISTTDGIAGHLYMVTPDYVQHGSTDYGATWNDMPDMPYGMGRGGLVAGHSALMNTVSSPQVIYSTSDSWQTYDSTLFNPWIGHSADLVSYTSLCYRMGTVYGTSRDSGNLCVSSDTTNNWSVGRTGVYYYGDWKAGACDELWGYCGRSVALDTGALFLDSVLVTNPPPRTHSWTDDFTPTNCPGEEYKVSYIDYRTVPEITELIVYHAQNYGGFIDSTYYYLVNYQVSIKETSQNLPTHFQISAYPNPFNSSTLIKWQTAFAQPTHLVVSDMLGRQVWEWTGRGSSVFWNGRSGEGGAVASGKYFITVQGGRNERQTMPITLVR